MVEVGAVEHRSVNLCAVADDTVAPDYRVAVNLAVVTDSSIIANDCVSLEHGTVENVRIRSRDNVTRNDHAVAYNGVLIERNIAYYFGAVVDARGRMKVI